MTPQQTLVADVTRMPPVSAHVTASAPEAASATKVDDVTAHDVTSAIVSQQHVTVRDVTSLAMARVAEYDDIDEEDDSCEEDAMHEPISPPTHHVMTSHAHLHPPPLQPLHTLRDHVLPPEPLSLPSSSHPLPPLVHQPPAPVDPTQQPPAALEAEVRHD